MTSSEMLEMYGRLQFVGVATLVGPWQAEIHRVPPAERDYRGARFQLVGTFPGGEIPLPGYGGVFTIHAALRALAIFDAGGTSAQALAGAWQAPHPKEEP